MVNPRTQLLTGLAYQLQPLHLPRRSDSMDSTEIASPMPILWSTVTRGDSSEGSCNWDKDAVVDWDEDDVAEAG